jgi:hypothetical protein
MGYTEEPKRERSPTPIPPRSAHHPSYPLRSSSHKKPRWQSWS